MREKTNKEVIEYIVHEYLGGSQIFRIMSKPKKLESETKEKRNNQKSYAQYTPHNVLIYKYTGIKLRCCYAAVCWYEYQANLKVQSAASKRYIHWWLRALPHEALIYLHWSSLLALSYSR